MSKASTRNLAIDIAKGACITGVVLTHALYGVIGDGEVLVFGGATENQNLGDATIQFLYTLLFCFFVISGYTYKPGRTFKENMVKRVKAIIPMYVACILLLTAALWAFVGFTSTSLTMDELVDAIWHSLIGARTFTVYPDAYVIGACYATLPLYYLMVYLVACIPFYLVVEKVVESWKKTLVAIIALASVSAVLMEVLPCHLPFACETSFAAAGMMLLGAYSGRADMLVKMDRCVKRWWYAPAILGLTAIGLVLSVVFTPNTSLMEGRFGVYGGLSSYLVFFNVVTCWLWLMMLSVVVAMIPRIGIALAFPGAYSMYVLVLHFFFLRIMGGLVHPIDESWLPIETVWEAIILGIAATILSTLVGLLVFRIKKGLKERPKAIGQDPC